jgi:hypothetical protein
MNFVGVYLRDEMDAVEDDSELDETHYAFFPRSGLEISRGIILVELIVKKRNLIIDSELNSA